RPHRRPSRRRGACKPDRAARSGGPWPRAAHLVKGRVMVLPLTSVAIEIEARAVRPRRISVLGATGSIGESTLDLIGRNPGTYQVVALTGGHNAERLADLAILHRAELSVIAEPSCSTALPAALARTRLEVRAGGEELHGAGD